MRASRREGISTARARRVGLERARKSRSGRSRVARGHLQEWIGLSFGSRLHDPLGKSAKAGLRGCQLTSFFAVVSDIHHFVAHAEVECFALAGWVLVVRFEVRREMSVAGSESGHERRLARPRCTCGYSLSGQSENRHKRLGPQAQYSRATSRNTRQC